MGQLGQNSIIFQKDWQFPIEFHKTILMFIKVGLSPSKKNFYCLLQWWLFKNDEKSFLFYLKSSFRSQDIYVFVLTIGYVEKTAWLER